MNWRGIPDWIMDHLASTDSWLIDSVFQPIANRLADRGITTHRAARWAFGIGAFTRIVGAMLYADWVDYSTLALTIISSVGALFSSGVSIWYVKLVQADEGNGANIWVLPKARVNFFMLRLILITVGISTALMQTLAHALTWYTNLADFLFLVGLYIWACRPRPPSRRHAPVPNSSSTERAC